MSDVENDLDDEILALAGAGDKKRKRRQGGVKSSTSKKRKADLSDSGIDGPESEEEDPYPLEGKYVDEADRLRLMQLSEVEREEALAARLEEKQRSLDKRLISQMVKEQQGGDIVARAAKRQHTARGSTKEKTKKLDELRAKRKAKDEKHRGSPKRERSLSPVDMDISDGESEDGQITKDEQEEERERKLLGTHKQSPAADEPICIEDLEKCQLTRDKLDKYCMTPWFQEYVQGAWVRFLIGHENGEAIYRICTVTNLRTDAAKPYKINERITNQTLDLKHGKAEKAFLMDKISNGPFLPKEFDRLVKTCNNEDVCLPTKKELEAKAVQMARLPTQPMTENDINIMLARKSELQTVKTTGLTTMERSRLIQERTLAQRRQDYAEVAEIEMKLQQFEEVRIERHVQRDNHAEMLARVNERNRKANLEVVRKAELAEAERKRRERKLGCSGTPQPQDPSARLKTKPRVFNAATPNRSLTPPANAAVTLQAGNTSMTLNVSPVPPSSLSSSLTKTLEASVIDSLEIDLGDF